MRSVMIKVLFVIDGVAERATSRILSTTLESRLDFSCYVQVVTNYVLAFDLAMQQDFHAIVLPHAKSIGSFRTAEFVDMVTSVCGFPSALIHTVAPQSLAHVQGETVRSTSDGGYMVDDLVSAIASIAKDSSFAAGHTSHEEAVGAVSKKGSKRPRQKHYHGVYTVPDHGHFHHNKKTRSEPQAPRQITHHAPPRQVSAEEAAYYEYCEWQWQMYFLAQAQAQAQARSQGHFYHEHPSLYPVYKKSSSISTPTTAFYHDQPYHPHSHSFPSFHTSHLPHLAHSYPHVPPLTAEGRIHHTHRYPAEGQGHMMNHHCTVRHHQRRDAQQCRSEPRSSDFCTSSTVTTEEEASSVVSNYNRHSNSTYVDAHACANTSDGSVACTSTDSVDSGDSSDIIDMDNFEFDEAIFNISQHISL